MKIEHIALYVQDLEGAKTFFETYFRAVPGAGYRNIKTGFRSYFLTFPQGGPRLELMTRPNLEDPEKAQFRTGYSHIAFSLGSREQVDALTRRLEADGCRIISGPRVTGDGYYESCLLALEDNIIEITE